MRSGASPRSGSRSKSNNRLKTTALFIVAGLLLLLALLGVRAAVTAVPAALLVNLGLGVAQVSNEVLLVAGILAGTALLAFALARVCRSDDALLLLYGGVVFLYAAAMVTHPAWQAINPFGPTQNSRYWGIGNQLETLLLAPLLAGAVLARRRFGPAGFLLFGFFGLVVVTDSRLGADGGGAIVLGVAFAVLGWRLFRLRLSGLIALLAGSAFAVLWLVQRGLAQPGPDHLRSAFSGNGSGFLSSLASRWPLSYLPALHAWTLVVPLLLVLTAVFVVAWRRAAAPATRDLLLAVGVALVTSLLINDSAAYELAGGIAVIGAAARFVPTSAPVPIRLRVPVFRRPRLAVEPVASESPPASRADLRVPLPEGPPLRALPVDEGAGPGDAATSAARRRSSRCSTRSPSTTRARASTRPTTARGRPRRRTAAARAARPPAARARPSRSRPRRRSPPRAATRALRPSRARERRRLAPVLLLCQ